MSEIEEIRSSLLTALDEAAEDVDETGRHVGTSTVMQWCIEWESVREEHQPPDEAGR